MIKEDEDGGFFSKIILLFLKYFTFYCMQVECSACEIVFSARAFSLRSNTQRSALLYPPSLPCEPLGAVAPKRSSEDM